MDGTFFGTSGVDGTSGINGTSGTSGVNGEVGPKGEDGTSGTSGLNGTFFGSSGTSGLNGTFFGTSGVNGSSGTSGVSGVVFPFTGSAEILGSLEVTNPTPGGTALEINGNAKFTEGVVEAGSIFVGDLYSLPTGPGQTPIRVRSSVVIGLGEPGDELNPSLNVASGSISSQLFLNPQTITENLEVPTGFNGMLVGPISISGEISVASGSVLTIV